MHDDTQFQKGSLYMRAQKCFCIKSGLNRKQILCDLLQCAILYNYSYVGHIKAALH